MDKETLIIVGGFLLAHGVAIGTAIKFSVSHLIKYNMHVFELKTALEKIMKLEKDLNQAHNKIRDMKK